MGFAWGGGRRKSCSTSIELGVLKDEKLRNSLHNDIHTVNIDCTDTLKNG